ncbi:MAG: glycosyltransferase family 39 protein, partial [Armatimonadota bacterium]
MAASLPLGDDETFYWVWSKHTAACYYDHPGMVAWLVGLSVKLFGDTNWAVRLPTIILGAISSVLMYAIGRRLFNTVTGFWSGIFFV